MHEPVDVVRGEKNHAAASRKQVGVGCPPAVKGWLQAVDLVGEDLVAVGEHPELDPAANLRGTNLSLSARARPSHQDWDSHPGNR